MFTYLWVGVLLLVGFFQWNGDHWHSKWFALLAAAAIGIGIRIARKTSWAAGAAFTYTVVSGLYVFAWRENYVMEWTTRGSPSYDPITGANMEGVTAFACVSFLLLTWVASSWSKKEIASLRTAFGIACLVDSAFVLLQCCLYAKKFSVGGFLDQDSMNGCFIAVTFPFLIEELGFRSVLQRILCAVPLIAIAASSFVGFARNSVAVLVVVMVAFLLWRRWGVRLCVLVGSSVAVALVGLYLLRPGVFDSSGRVQLYLHVFRWFLTKDAVYWVLGLGNGSYFIFGPGIQHIDHFGDWNGSWNLWMHSDWLQTLFEQGLVGLGIYLWLAWDCFSKCLRAGDGYLLAALLGFAATAVFEFPVHVSLFAVLAVTIVASCLQSPDADQA